MAKSIKKTTAQAAEKKIISKKAPPKKKSAPNAKKKTLRKAAASKITPKPAKKKPLKKKVLKPKKARLKTARVIPVPNAAGELQTRVYSSSNIQSVPTEPAAFFQSVEGELPGGYGDHFVYLMVRDPQWLYAYWEIQKSIESDVLRQLGGSWDKVRSVLRIYNLSAEGAGRKFSDIELTLGAVNWFIEVEPNQNYAVEIGLRHEDGRFIALVRSNAALTPRVTMSEVLDEEWMGIDFEKMYALSGGFALGQSSEALKKMMHDRLHNAVTSGSGAGWGASSGGTIGGDVRRRKFWFHLDCELIIYGATEPDAAVCINGKPITLRPDGTFTLRYSLPDGQIQVAAQAVSADGLEEKTITPMVVRKTQIDHPAVLTKRRS